MIVTLHTADSNNVLKVMSHDISNAGEPQTFPPCKSLKENIEKKSVLTQSIENGFW